MAVNTPSSRRHTNVRADVVDKGRNLAKNPHYPEKEIVNQLARKILEGFAPL